MKGLKKKVGYTSMKIRHIERQAKMFPSLVGLPGEVSSEHKVGECLAMDEEDYSEEDPLNIHNPSPDQERRFNKQKQLIEELQSEQKTHNELKERLQQISSEKDILIASNKRFEKKLEFARKITEQKIYDTITHDSYREDPHHITVLSTTLNEDDYELEDPPEEADLPDDTADDESKPPRSRKGKFLEFVEEKVEKKQLHSS